MSDESVPVRTDPVVDRVNELVTTGLDLAAAVCAAIAAWWLGRRFGGPDTAWAAAAVMLIIFSGLAQMRTARPRIRPAPARPHREIPPGPADPGNLHVRGR